MTTGNDNEQLFMLFFGYAMHPDYSCKSTPEKPSQDEEESEDQEEFAPTKGGGATRGCGGGATRGCRPQTDKDKGLMPEGDDRLKREWPKKDLVPLTAEELMAYMQGYGWALQCVRTDKFYPMEWAPCKKDDKTAVSDLASTMREGFTAAWQEATDVSGLPQQATIVPCQKFKLQCPDVEVLMKGGEYNVVLTDTPHDIFCQFARPVTCFIGKKKQLHAMSLAHNAAVALVEPQKETWYHENFKGGVSLIDPYDKYGWLKYNGDKHGFLKEDPFGRDITSMTNAEKICSETVSAKLKPLQCFSGKTVGSNPGGGPVMGSVSGLTAQVTGKKTQQTSITSAVGPPLLEAGHGIIVKVDFQAFIPVFGGPDDECSICFDPSSMINTICLTSCGHAKVCKSCVERIGHGTDKRVCPMCREPIHWAVEVKTDTTPEVEERPPKTAKLAGGPSAVVPTSNGAAAGPSEVVVISDDDDELMRLMHGSPKPTSNGAAAGPSAAAIDSDAELEARTRENSPDFDWTTIDINYQNEYWELVEKMGDRLGPRNLGKYVTSVVWDTLLTLPKDHESGLSRVARISDQFQ